MPGPIALLPLLLALAQPAPSAPDPLARDAVEGPLGARLDAQLTRFAAYGYSGTVLVAREGKVLLLKGYGLADVERRIPNSAATRFEMNSMTKMFTGVALLQLAAEGRLRLSDPVASHLEGFRPEKRTATLEQLAAHTSGLIVEGSNLSGESRAAFVRDVATSPPESPPGEKYRYSNAGYSLLAALIAEVSGESYETYLQRHLFAPAGMKTAIFRDAVPADDPLFAHGYVGDASGPKPGPPNPYVWGTVGAGGVWATVGDMYRWLEAVEAGRFLPPAQSALLHAPPAPPAEEAFGWRVDTAPEGRPRIQKGGGSDDFASQLLYFPRERLAVIWTNNDRRQRWRQALNKALPELAFGGEPVSLPPLPAIVPLDSKALALWSGRYASDGGELELRAGAGYLYAAANPLGIAAELRFFPQDDRHFTAFDPATLGVTRLELNPGDPVAITFVLPDGRRIVARRPAAAVH